MNKYLIQVKNSRTTDSSHRVIRRIIVSNCLEDLFEQINKYYPQEEVEVLAEEKL